MPLDPQAAAFIEKISAGGTSQVGELSVDDMRASVRNLIPLGYEFEDVNDVNDTSIPVDGGSITLRIYRPRAFGSRPVVLWVHGGSFVRCGLDTHDTMWRRFANLSGSTVVAVDYRLPPEYPHPSPLNDVYTAARWVEQRLEELGNGRLVVAGESSGGTIATALALRARERGHPKLDRLLLIEPLLDRDSGLPSRHELAKDFLLTDGQIQWAYDQYAPGSDPNDPLVYPLRTADVSGLPPTLIVTVEYSPLRDEGEYFAERLQAAGVEATAVRVPGLIHPAVIVPKAIEAGANVLDEAVRLLCAST